MNQTMNQIKRLFSLKDISHFSNTTDYLAILNAVLFVDITGVYLTMNNIFIKSKYLQYWYETFGLLAVIADVLIIVIGIIITRFLYHSFFKTFSIWNFIFLALVIQIIHDILFYLFFSRLVPKGQNKMFDVFKNYAKEVGPLAILGDSTMMAASCLLASWYASYSVNINIINLIVTLYLMTYILNYTAKK